MNSLRFWCSGPLLPPPESLASAPTVAPFGFWVSAPPLPLEAATEARMLWRLLMKPPLMGLLCSVNSASFDSSVDPPELLAAARAVVGAGSKSQLLRVVIPCCYGYCESDWELRFWLPVILSDYECLFG
ncbi:uncharacterized protein DS421_18g613340 [Arachis hypogaea]|nr:uncharacterized protein DS421_18g613340 [Arachis hypogaea]